MAFLEKHIDQLNILDMIEFMFSINTANLINGEIFNVGYENLKIKESFIIKK